MELQKEPIINPIDKKIIAKELNSIGKIKSTLKGDNDIYIIDGQNAPNTMLEVGRLRELAFRQAGGGTGLSCDLDEDDTAENGYKQLILFDKEEQEIIGGYRYIVCYDEKPKHLSTEHYFKFSDRFRKEFLPKTIELGRSFIQPKYQARNGNKKSIFALDNLWEGIGTLVTKYPHIEYFFGKVTMYINYNEEACVKLFVFLNKYFKDNDNLIEPINKKIHLSQKYDLSNFLTGKNFQEDYKIVSKEIKALGETIPPMFNMYMSLTPTMKVFGTTINKDFGDVEETGILITISDIYKEKYERYILGK